MKTYPFDEVHSQTNLNTVFIQLHEAKAYVEKLHKSIKNRKKAPYLCKCPLCGKNLQLGMSERDTIVGRNMWYGCSHCHKSFFVQIGDDITPLEKMAERFK